MKPEHVPAELDRVRHSIDAVDLVLADVLTRRAQLVRHAQRIKALSGYPVRDPARERRIFERTLLADRKGYSRDTLERIWGALFDATADFWSPVLVGDSIQIAQGFTGHLDVLRGADVDVVELPDNPRDLLPKLSGRRVLFVGSAAGAIGLSEPHLEWGTVVDSDHAFRAASLPGLSDSWWNKSENKCAARLFMIQSVE